MADDNPFAEYHLPTKQPSMDQNNPFAEYHKEVNTIFGKMPSPEEFGKYINNPNMINEMINTAAGAPGINVIGKGVGAIASGLKNTISQARTDLSPLEQQIIKASEEHKLASEDYNQLVSDIDNNISAHLNKGAQHDVRTANGVFEKADAERKALSQGYKDLEKDFEQRQVPINNESSIKEKTDEMHSLIKSGNARSPEMDKVLKELDALKSETPKTAKDYLHTLQSVKDYARVAREKAFSTGMNRAERIEHENAFNALDEKAEEISKTLEENIGPENAEKLKELNNGWRTRVVPLQRNNVYQKIKYKGKMSDNIIKELRGNKDPGNQIIKEFIQNDPELLKNVVGQRYADKVAGLHTANETALEYINKMPELKGMIEQRAYAQNAIPSAEKKITEALTSGKREDIHKLIAELQEKIPVYDKTINELRQKRLLKDISLSDKVKYETQYEKALKAKKAAQSKLKTMGGIIGASVLGYPTIKFGSALFGASKGENSGG